MRNCNYVMALEGCLLIGIFTFLLPAGRLDWTMIEFQDNQPVIDLVSKKPRGLLIQLEEQGLLGRRANNKALLQVRWLSILCMVVCVTCTPRHETICISSLLRARYVQHSASFVIAVLKLTFFRPFPRLPRFI